MNSYKLVAAGIAIAGAVLLAAGLYFLLTDPAWGDEIAGDSVSALFEEYPALDGVWQYDNEKKSWSIYIRALEPKTLLTLYPGRPYVVEVSEEVVVRGQRLTCKDSRCLNIITWR